jgi:hypothetical protein
LFYERFLPIVNNPEIGQSFEQVSASFVELLPTDILANDTTIYQAICNRLRSVFVKAD